MPHTICHLSLFFGLQEQLQAQRPDIAVLVDWHVAATLAGVAAPDALRIFGNDNKFSTHFYVDRDPATWGRSVETMCRMRPEISDPRCLSTSEQAFVLGYISHLTVDEAFREIVTAQLLGHPQWREIVVGLWSLADELPLGRPHLVKVLKQISQADIPNLVDLEPVQRLLSVTAEILICRSSWERELLQREHFSNRFGVKDGQADWERRREMAADFFDTARRQAFVEEAIAFGFQEADRYWDGRYAGNGRG
jgi:hypothetical protein